MPYPLGAEPCCLPTKVGPASTLLYTDSRDLDVWKLVVNVVRCNDCAPSNGQTGSQLLITGFLTNYPAERAPGSAPAFTPT